MEYDDLCKLKTTKREGEDVINNNCTREAQIPTHDGVEYEHDICDVSIVTNHQKHNVTQQVSTPTSSHRTYTNFDDVTFLILTNLHH